MKTNHRRNFVARLERDPTMDTLHCESHHNAAQHEKAAIKRARNQAVRRTERTQINEQLEEELETCLEGNTEAGSDTK